MSTKPEGTNLPSSKTVHENGVAMTLYLADSPMLACAGCGQDLKEGQDYYGVCSDCGGMFCESCMKDGTFDDHACEEDEEYE